MLISVGTFSKVTAHVLGFNDTSMWVILCHLPEKGRKEIQEEMKERDKGERKMKESEETKK